MWLLQMNGLPGSQRETMRGGERGSGGERGRGERGEEERGMLEGQQTSLEETSEGRGGQEECR